MRLAVLLTILMLTGCSRGVRYKHVTIVNCGSMGLDVRLTDGTVRHYDVWNFTMPSCSLVPLNTDVSLALEGGDDVTGTYHFGWVRKN